jgi:hypothetical protein
MPGPNSSLMTTAGAASNVRPAPNSIAAVTMNKRVTLVRGRDSMLLIRSLPSLSHLAVAEGIMPRIVGLGGQRLHLDQ